MVTKKLIITTDDDGSFTLDVEPDGHYDFEVLGVLRQAQLMVEHTFVEHYRQERFVKKYKEIVGEEDASDASG
jgi:hypothetical protein